MCTALTALIIVLVFVAAIMLALIISLSGSDMVNAIREIKKCNKKRRLK